MEDIKNWIYVEKTEIVDMKSWENRVKCITDIISDDCTSVVDLGCGSMLLKQYLRNGIEYYPVDYIDRGKGTIICDFNLHEFPRINAHTLVASGILEHIEDYTWFIEQMCSCCAEEIIISYAYVDEAGLEEETFNKRRRISQNGYLIDWMNSLTCSEIKRLFQEQSYSIILEQFIPIKQVLMKFIRE